jgi:hypothetical protein
VEGSQQGCNLGNLMCSMAFLPLTSTISTILKTSGFCKAFVDDFTLAGEHTETIEAVKYLLTSGELLGYLTHMKDKGKILIGKCDSLLEAIRRKEEYIEL